MAAPSRKSSSPARWPARPACFCSTNRTRGVDVAAKFDIYAFLQEITAAGASVVVVSSDHEELLRLCSRVAVLREGRIAAPVPTEGLTPQRLLGLCYGDPRD